jgi:hypothetical protein
MHILSVSLEKLESIDYERVCPYNGINTCMASFTSLKLDKQKKADCCSTEDYDDCPIYLSKLLRTR